MKIHLILFLKVETPLLSGACVSGASLTCALSCSHRKPSAPRRAAPFSFSLIPSPCPDSQSVTNVCRGKPSALLWTRGSSATELPWVPRFLPPLSVKPHSLSASPPDGLPPFNAGVAAHGDRGRRWEGTESQRIDLRTAAGPQRGNQHMKRSTTAPNK